MLKYQTAIESNENVHSAIAQSTAVCVRFTKTQPLGENDRAIRRPQTGSPVALRRVANSARGARVRRPSRARTPSAVVWGARPERQPLALNGASGAPARPQRGPAQVRTSRASARAPPSPSLSPDAPPPPRPASPRGGPPGTARNPKMASLRKRTCAAPPADVGEDSRPSPL